MQRRPDVDALVERRDGALLQIEPVVGADGQSQKPQASQGKDAAQQGQGLPAAGTHDPSPQATSPGGSEKRENVTASSIQITGIKITSVGGIIYMQFFYCVGVKHTTDFRPEHVIRLCLRDHLIIVKSLLFLIESQHH